MGCKKKIQITLSGPLLHDFMREFVESEKARPGSCGKDLIRYALKVKRALRDHEDCSRDVAHLHGGLNPKSLTK